MKKEEIFTAEISQRILHALRDEIDALADERIFPDDLLCKKRLLNAVKEKMIEINKE